MSKAIRPTTTSGGNNVAIGLSALEGNTVGSRSIAIGSNALAVQNPSTATDMYNVAIGDNAGNDVTTGTLNTFVGNRSGQDMTTGGSNTLLGGYDGNQSSLDLRAEDSNIVLSTGGGVPLLWARLTGTHVHSQTTALATAFVSAINSTNASSQLIRGANSASNINDVSATQFVVFGTGNVQNTNNSYGAISDRRLKENIVDASSQWDDIKAIKVRKYSMIEDKESAANRIGVIAQELEESGMSGLVDEHIDLGPNDEDLGTTTKGVKYSVLYMKAIKALQEAMARIETLEAEVSALKSGG